MPALLRPASFLPALPAMPTRMLFPSGARQVPMTCLGSQIVYNTTAAQEALREM